MSHEGRPTAPLRYMPQLDGLRRDALIGSAYFAVVLMVSVGVASLSWFLFEQPINALKQRFPHPRDNARAAPPGPPSSAWAPLAAK